MTRYPNLVEMHKYYPYGEPAMCDHAGIEPEVLRAVLYDGEPLEPLEIIGLAGLYRCPIGVLEQQEIIMLDVKKWRHKMKVAEVDNLYIRLKCMAREDNREAEKYLKWADGEHQRFMNAARVNELSYCHYLGMKEQIRRYISSSTPGPKKRRIRNEKGGAI